MGALDVLLEEYGWNLVLNLRPEDSRNSKPLACAIRHIPVERYGDIDEDFYFWNHARLNQQLAVASNGWLLLLTADCRAGCRFSQLVLENLWQLRPTRGAGAHHPPASTTQA